MAAVQQRKMKSVQQKFRMRGLTLTLDALKEAVAFLDESILSSSDALESLLGGVDNYSCNQLELYPLFARFHGFISSRSFLHSSDEDPQLPQIQLLITSLLGRLLQL